MKNTLKLELASHILDRINDGVIDNNNIDDWHFHCFNEDYYMIGYYQCSQWLKKHEIDVLEAVRICQEYEIENFGESTNIYDNSEKIVNMLAYIYGQELLSEIEAETIKKLKKTCKKLLG